VHRGGRSWAGRLLVLRCLQNGLPVSRYGFSISKRVGKAVVRNRVKRRLREVARSLSTKPGSDIVVIARSPAAEATYRDLRDCFEGLLVKARLLSGGAAGVEDMPGGRD
jgi:ribonuclease P protein component